MDKSRQLAFYGRGRSNYFEIANTMAMYQLVALGIDMTSNLIVDSTTSDPMAVFFVFLIQALTILVNLISFIMVSSHQAIQSSRMKSKSRVHTMNTVSLLAYLTLTITWYIWSLRRSWPRGAEQFSYSSSKSQNSSTNTSDSLPFGTGFDHLNEEREFFMLWSPGFIALYTAQRSFALIYYSIYLKSLFILVNAGRFHPTENDYSSKLSDNTKRGLQPLRSISAILDDEIRESDRSQRSSEILTSSVFRRPSNEYIQFPPNLSIIEGLTGENSRPTPIVVTTVTSTSKNESHRLGSPSSDLKRTKAYGRRSSNEDTFMN